MADVNLGLGEWEGQGGGLRGHMECSLDVFDVAGAERFTSSFKVTPHLHTALIVATMTTCQQGML